MKKNVLVVKIGTALLTNDSGNIDNRVVKKISGEISGLHERYNLILVSSGAVGSGKKYLRQYKGTTNERKAAAAIGNPLLMRMYYQHFSKNDLMVAQVLCERHHFSDRKLFVQLRDTFAQLWKNNVIPIVNENDLVSNLELKFTDNDELATLLAVGFDAETLIICTSAGGFMDSDKKVVPLIEEIDKNILGFVRADKSSVGMGGMASKLTYTKLAMSLGIQVIICGLSGTEPLHQALNGQYGSIFLPKKINMNARNKWLASSSITIGQLIVDRGAEKALKQRHSLLSIGIKEVVGKFLANEVVKILNEEKDVVAVAKVRLDAAEIYQSLNEKHIVAAHADDIVCL